MGDENVKQRSKSRRFLLLLWLLLWLQCSRCESARVRQSKAINDFHNRIYDSHLLIRWMILSHYEIEAQTENYWIMDALLMANAVCLMPFTDGSGSGILGMNARIRFSFSAMSVIELEADLVIHRLGRLCPGKVKSRKCDFSAMREKLIQPQQQITVSWQVAR